MCTGIGHRRMGKILAGRTWVSVGARLAPVQRAPEYLRRQFIPGQDVRLLPL